MGVCLKQSNLELLAQPTDEKASKTFKLSIFLKLFLVRLFFINIRDFRGKKSQFFENELKMVGNRQTPICFGKQAKWKLLSNILFQTQ